MSTATVRYGHCLAGTAPAEILPTELRALLVAELHGRGWTDVEIAEHTCMTTYTTGRIRARLGLAAHRDMKGAVA